MDSSGSDLVTSSALIVLLAGAMLLSLCALIVFVYATYFLLTLPMRRNERPRLLLDLIEQALESGATPELALADAAISGDPWLKGDFQRIAASLRSGVRFEVAVTIAPRLVPPPIAAMLRAGARLGDIRKVLPACRRRLQDAVSQVRGALNYLLLLGIVVAPASLMVPILIRVKVLPVFRVIFSDLYRDGPLPALTRLVLGENSLLFSVQIFLIVFIWALLIAYIGGPRLRRWLGPAEHRLLDWLEFHLPWRRKRLQRDFSSTLAVLLDGGVPESEAVMLAAESTANRRMANKALQIRERLSAGVPLGEALRLADDSGELQWRLANASHRRSGFLRALSGWHETLDAKAFQLEQTAAQLTTTGLVLLNGLVIGLFVVGMFLALIHVLDMAVLW